MKDVIVGIDAGTSVIKSVAFSLSGEQLADSAVANTYYNTSDKGVEQDPVKTWEDAAKTLQALLTKIPDLAQRIAAISVTGQGCLLYTSPSPRDKRQSRMPSSA